MFLASHVLVAALFFLVGGVAVTYAVAVGSKHLKPLWPYISYAGNLPVESCIFSLTFNASSCALLLVVVLRYLQVLESISTADFPEKKKIRAERFDLAALIFGVFGAAGLGVIGSYQQNVFHSIHVCGVFFCTVGTHLFNACQTAFSFGLLRERTSPGVRRVRVAFLVLASLVSLAVPVVYASSPVRGPARPRFEWEWTKVAELGEDEATDATAVLEWILFAFNLVLLASHYPDMKKISLEKDRISFLE